MAKVKAPNELKKTIAEFELLGRYGETDFSFTIDKEASSGWLGSQANLKINCGLDGDIYCRTKNSGFFPNPEYDPELPTDLEADSPEERNNVEETNGQGNPTKVYLHGKKVKPENPKQTQDDYDNKWDIPFADRHDTDLQETLGNGCFVKAFLSEGDKDPHLSKFITEYDLAKFLKENLKDESIVKVSGKLVHSIYNGENQVSKEFTYIGISKLNAQDMKLRERETELKEQEVEFEEQGEKGAKGLKKVVSELKKIKSELEEIEANFFAKFKQNMYLTSKSLGKYDKAGEFFPLEANVIDYINKVTQDGTTKKINKSASFKANYKLPLLGREKKILAKLAGTMFKIDKPDNMTEIIVEGRIRRSGGATKSMTYEELPEEIRDLVDMEAYTLDDAIEMCVGKQDKTQEEYLALKPSIKIVDVVLDGKTIKKPIVQINKIKFSPSDLITYQQRVNAEFGEENTQEYENISSENADGEEEMDEETRKMLAEMEG